MGFAATLAGDSVAAGSRIGPTAACMRIAAMCMDIDSAPIDSAPMRMDIDLDTVAGGSDLASNPTYPIAPDSRYFLEAAGAAMCRGDSRLVGAFEQSLVPVQIPVPAIPAVRASTSNCV